MHVFYACSYTDYIPTSCSVPRAAAVVTCARGAAGAAGRGSGCGRSERRTKVKPRRDRGFRLDCNNSRVRTYAFIIFAEFAVIHALPPPHYSELPPALRQPTVSPAVATTETVHDTRQTDTRTWVHGTVSGSQVGVRRSMRQCESLRLKDSGWVIVRHIYTPRF